MSDQTKRNGPPWSEAVGDVIRSREIVRQLQAQRDYMTVEELACFQQAATTLEILASALGMPQL